MKSNISDMSVREEDKQVKKLKDLIEMSYYSLKKLEE